MAKGLHLEEHVVNTITRARVEKEETSVGGKHVPLSVYEKKGFNITLMEERCKDWEEHPILGRCYRVNVKAVHSKTIEEAVKKEFLEAKRQSTKKKGQKRTSSSRGRSESTGPGRSRSECLSGSASERDPTPPPSRN